MTEQHKNQFHKSICLCRYAPVLNRQNMIVPLTDNGSLNAWGEIIGFNENPKSILPVPETMYGKARIFDGCSFTVKDIKSGMTFGSIFVRFWE